MWSILALGAAESLINRGIDLDAISRIQFNTLHGKLLRVVIQHPQLSVDVYFDLDRIRLEPTPMGQATQPSIFEQRPYDKQYNATADAVLTVENVVALLKLLWAAPEEIGHLPLDGDYHLLQKLQQIMQDIDPDLAAHLSPWLGPQLAHELGKLLKAPQFFTQSAQNAAFYAEDWLKEDSQLLAARWQWQTLTKGTRQLQQDLDRLEAKIKQLQAQ